MVSCIKSTSGRARPSHHVTFSSRARSEFTFQVAMPIGPILPSRARVSALDSHHRGGPMARKTRATLELTHLGAAGWQISDGQRVILLDPYVSRLRFKGRFGSHDAPPSDGDTRRVFGPGDELVPDVAAIDAHITRADFILHSHSHFNHTLDMPYIARKTGAIVIGTESTTNLARVGGVAEAQLRTVRGGEDYEL